MDIVTAVCDRINHLFKTENIYTEESTQDIELPAFFVYKIDNPYKRLVSNVFKYEPIINIVYEPKTADLLHLQEMEETMLMGLEYIWIDENSTIRGLDLSSTTLDDAVSMTITYPYTLRKNKHYEFIDIGEDEDIVNPIDPDDGNNNVDKPDTDEGKEKEKLDPDMNEEIDFMRRLDRRYGRKG